MEKLKSFLWFSGKVFLAILVVEIIDAKTGMVSKLKDAIRGVTG